MNIYKWFFREVCTCFWSVLTNHDEMEDTEETCLYLSSMPTGAQAVDSFPQICIVLGKYIIIWCNQKHLPNILLFPGLYWRSSWCMLSEENVVQSCILAEFWTLIIILLFGDVFSKSKLNQMYSLGDNLLGLFSFWIGNKNIYDQLLNVLFFLWLYGEDERE